MLCALCGLTLTMECSRCAAPYCAYCNAFYCADAFCTGQPSVPKRLDRRQAVTLLAGLAGLTFLSVQQGAPLATSVPVTHTNAAPVVESPGNYVALARQSAIEAGLDPDCFVRQINEESGFNPGAFSPAGAVGIAQFMPATAASLGIDPHDPVAALRGAARLMASYVAQYHSYAMALAAYNAGSGAVSAAYTAGGPAHWQAFLPAETQHYITAILG